MLIALLVAGAVFFLAGLLGIADGMRFKEFSFGNTEILAGVVVTCTGALMMGLWIAVRELKGAGLRSGAATVAKPPREVFLAPAPAGRSDQDGLLFNQPGAVGPVSAEPASLPSAPLPWHEETSSRDRVRSEVAPMEPTAPEEAAPAPKRRNLLFSSTSRKERERAEGRAADTEPADPRPAAPPVAPSSKPNEAPPASFEDAWPQSERPRSVDVSRRTGRAPPTVAEASGAERSPPAPRIEEAPQVTVLKSGVVDGMAYSLYSDGSIEAQMPEGMMRFASIDDLRTHLDQRT